MCAEIVLRERDTEGRIGGEVELGPGFGFGSIRERTGCDWLCGEWFLYKWLLNALQLGRE